MDFQKITKKKWLIALFVIALILRIIFVFSMPIKLWDETIYINLGYDLSNNPADYSFANNGWSDFMPDNSYPLAGFRAPLLPYLISFLYLLNLGFLINFLIPLIGALSVILVYVLGKNLFNESTGLISASLFTFIPLHIFYSGRVLTDVLFTFFVLVTFISFWKGYENNNKKYKVLFGLFLALSLLSRYTALWIMPIFLLYFLIKYKSLRFLKDKYLWYAVIIFFLALTPWFIYGIIYYHNPIGSFMHGMKASSYWGGIQPWNFFFSSWWQMFSIAGFIFIFGLLSIIHKKEYLRKEIYLLLIWFIFFLGMIIYMPHKEDRFIIPIIPSLVILSAFFINKIKEYKRLLIAVILLILIFSTCSNFYNTYKLYHSTNTECFEQIGMKLKEIKGNFMVVSENPPLFRYYVKQENAYYPNPLNNKTIKELETSKDKPVYFVFARFNSGLETEKWQKLKQIMKENYNLVFECSKDAEVNFIYSN